MENVRSKIEKTFSIYNLLFNGERHLRENQLSKNMNISYHILQTYIYNELSPDILLCGKVLCKECDVETC